MFYFYKKWLCIKVETLRVQVALAPLALYWLAQVNVQSESDTLGSMGYGTVKKFLSLSLELHAFL